MRTLTDQCFVGSRLYRSASQSAAISVIVTSLLLTSLPTFPAVRYVNADNTASTPPYTTWATAATNIQDAIDVAAAGDEIVVTNGVYQTGGRVVDGAMTNRVAVTKPLTVRSVNGPEMTVIEGYQLLGAYLGLGDSAVRCVYLGEGATLVGFTLTNGATRGSGDYYTELFAGGVWCVSTNATVSNCVLRGNSAIRGGGAYGGTLNNCTLTGNSAYYGGGANLATLNYCMLSGNSAAEGGGGAQGGTLNNCTLTANSATYSGGGASSCELNNCAITSNSAGSYGGGAAYATLNNSTLTGNSARFGGGVAGGTLNNCIVYYNVAQQNGANYTDAASAFNYSCTTPLPPGGVGNIDAEPQLASVAHLSVDSPCRAGGSATYATGLDIDGEAWANPPSIGCDELQPGSVTGPLRVVILASATSIVIGFEVNFTAQTIGRTSLSRWEFGDGTVVTNRPYTAHAWAHPGDYLVVFWAYNESSPEGVSTTTIVHVVEPPVHYVAAGSSNPVAPYSSWATAATNIQDAVDTALAGAVVLVSNGVYQTGGRLVDGAMTNRVAVTKPLTVRSVNGPEVTVIEGYKVPGTSLGLGNCAVRCVYLTNGTALVGFTLTNGATRDSRDLSEGSGGGVWCESASVVVSNCVFGGNSAGRGGGAYQGTVNNSTLSGNSAIYGGGGASSSTLNNCTLTANWTSGARGSSGGGGSTFSTLNNCTLTGNSQYGEYGGGGGASFCTLNNCIVYYNFAGQSGGNYLEGTFNYSCTTPLPPDGVGNLDKPPLFVDPASGNLRLQSNSPCINAGLNPSAPGDTDLDGNPRIAGGTVDVGAYEFQSPRSLISYAWLQQYVLPIDPFTESADPDGDRLTNWQEWRAGTDPTNSLSVLRLLTPAPLGPDLVVTWESVPGRSYFLEWSTNLGAPPGFERLATQLPASENTTTFTHANAAVLGPVFYRVGVE